MSEARFVHERFSRSAAECSAQRVAALTQVGQDIEPGPGSWITLVTSVPEERKEAVDKLTLELSVLERRKSAVRSERSASRVAPDLDVLPEVTLDRNLADLVREIERERGDIDYQDKAERGHPTH